MVTSRQLHRLATRPHEYARFLQTGKVARGVRPTGPLVELLTALGPGVLSQLVGVTVDSRLGYTGKRQFQFGSQAFRWVAPSSEVFDSFPAESWRDKRFTRKLYLEDLADCCLRFPDSLYARFPHLRKPGMPSPTPPSVQSDGTFRATEETPTLD